MSIAKLKEVHALTHPAERPSGRECAAMSPNRPLRKRCKRNVAEYEGEIDIDDALVDALILAAREIEKRIPALKQTK